MADNEEVHYERERSRSRDRGDTYDEDARAGSVGSQEDAGDNRRDRNDNQQGRREENPDVNNLYVTNLSFQTTDESLRAAFQQFGEIYNASIIKEPVSQNSRGFGFVSFITLEDCEKALAAMHGADVDGRSIRVEKARRNTGYQKTPGQYLGPPGLSARFTPGGRDDRPRDRGYGDDRGGYRGGGRGGYDRDRERDPRDVRERDSRGGYGGGGGGYMGGRDDMYRGGPPAYRGPPGGGYPDRGIPPGGGMYRDEGRFEPRYDPYARGRDGPPPRYDDRGRPPPMGMGGPPRGMPQPYGYDGPNPNRGIPPSGGPMGPGPHMARGGRRSRSPPPAGGDDRRGPQGAPAGAPAYDSRGPPSGGYGGGAGYYSGPPGGAGGPPRNGGRY